jgi:hypothetical protein
MEGQHCSRSNEFPTNEVNVNMTGARLFTILNNAQRAGYITTPYTITIKDGATVVNSIAVTR